MATLTWFRVVAAGAIGMIAWRGQLWGSTIKHLIAVPDRRPTDSLNGRCHLLCLLRRSFIARDSCRQGLLAVQ